MKKPAIYLFAGFFMFDTCDPAGTNVELFASRFEEAGKRFFFLRVYLLGHNFLIKLETMSRI
ncbi:hypothetical protein [Dyadobacter frigoris]|uniref:Uncharacterized protein n=1 Tax=Dyadobacter frigoris TaxID=2576211 RepID=A0A4U6CVK3_9BACT|nr:hypothetical protein [Dyadobacter frigoris]TKT85314.1 hypothetical protein FDK13_33945 [Dyadobacter frigoris]